MEGMDFLLWVGLSVLEQCEDQLLELNEMQTLQFLNRLPSSAFDNLVAHLNSQEKV